MTLSISAVLTLTAVLSLSLISRKKMFKMINVKIIVAVKPTRPTICLMASGSSLYFFKLFSIFGKPVSHSKSPLIHNAVFQKYLPNYLYCRTEIENGENLRKVFFDLKLSGASVTVPYKEVAFQICDEVRGVAKQIGAVNCLHLENEKLIGYNTDVYGFLDSIEEWQKDINSVLIIGAGGTSKALTYSFLEKKYQVTILNRSEKRLKAFENLDVNLFTWDNFKPENYDLIVNVTSAGLDLKLPDEVNLPAPKEILENFDKLIFNDII